MKFRIIYALFVLSICGVLTLSNSTGAGSNNFNCNNCHNGSSSNTAIDSIVLREVSTNEKAIRYSPNTNYIITIYGNNDGTLNRFGFQATHNGKGAFSSPSGDCKVSGNIWEHQQKIVGTASKFQISARWTAPAAGGGLATFNAYLNAVNNDNATGGDKASQLFTFIIDELTAADSAKVEVQQVGTNDPKNPNEKIIYKAYPTNGGAAPQYQWKLNGINVGDKTFEDEYASTNFKGGDSVSCWMYTSKVGALPNPAISNIMIVKKFGGGSSIGQNNSSKPTIYIDNNSHLAMVNATQKSQLSIYSLRGTKVYCAEIQQNEWADLAHLPKGLYVVHIKSGAIDFSQKLHLK